MLKVVRTKKPIVKLTLLMIFVGSVADAVTTAMDFSVCSKFGYEGNPTIQSLYSIFGNYTFSLWPPIEFGFLSATYLFVLYGVYPVLVKHFPRVSNYREGLLFLFLGFFIGVLANTSASNFELYLLCKRV